MSQFIQEFLRNGNISFLGMRNTAVSLIPSDRTEQEKLYTDLRRGTGILDDDPHLNMYLLSFGKMHKAKLDAAFSSMPGLQKILDVPCEIYDWGCGQGTATICFLDFLRSHDIHVDIPTITLVEPSIPATERAKEVIDCYGLDTKVDTINKVFDDLREADFCKNSTRRIHLFSNILDVDAFDLARFTQLFQSLFRNGENYFFCVGPYYPNNRRVDEFVAATCPDVTFATFNHEKGQWINEWTIALRVFSKCFETVEAIEDIRKRIEEFHTKDQFFAGYILDAISDESASSRFALETEELFRALSVFDVKSNQSLELPDVRNSKLAVLTNIVSRGLPTKAPILLENVFAENFNISTKPSPGGILHYPSSSKITGPIIYEALHVIDPRFDLDYYNADMLESSFEREFIGGFLRGSSQEYLIQVLEPQRQLSSIVKIPSGIFSRDQRVDFAVELPYGTSQAGFVVEIDGEKYHSNISQSLTDERRNREVKNANWNTYRISDLIGTPFLKDWEQEASLNGYLSVLRENSKKEIAGEWRDVLEVVLSPLAIARIQRMLIHAMMTGVLDMQAKNWDIVIVERDVPCGVLAVEDLNEAFEKISILDGTNEKLPKINLTIVSSNEFYSSPLHRGHKVETTFPTRKFDLCIDISILLRDNVDALPLNVNANTAYCIRSCHYVKRSRLVCSADNIEYEPLVEKDERGAFHSIENRESALAYFMRNIFRKPGFRPGQLPIISHALADKTTIGLLPTGGGKSLTYQLSCMMQPGVTIVVDPLVSLMVDQVRGLRSLRIDACDCVNSGMTVQEKGVRLNQLQNGSLQFLLLSPERFMMQEFRDNLVSMAEMNGVYFSYGVIDEVHCVSEWGHDFRTSYLHLGRNMINHMRTRTGKPLPIIGLTATASFDVLADVERELTLGGNLAIDSETIVRPENDSRDELSYRIVQVDSDIASLMDSLNPCFLNIRSDWRLKECIVSSKKHILYQLISDVPKDLLQINSRTQGKSCYNPNLSVNNFFDSDINGKFPNAGLIFCPHAKGLFGVKDSYYLGWDGSICHGQEGVASSLAANCSNFLKIGTFTGGASPLGDMQKFNENELNMMVATKAFGMGIDKPNIRYTIHFSYPSSIESYVQEAGRGGRDKINSISYVLFDPLEYVDFTSDKVNDIRRACISSTGKDQEWLYSLTDKFVLMSELRNLCYHYGCGEEDVDVIVNFCKINDFVENLDRNINLNFHDASFPGVFKEKIILQEMTDCIMNARPTRISRIQDELRERTGESDILLKLDPNRDAVKIVSEENPRFQYGYLFLESLHALYTHVNFEMDKCIRITTALIEILSNVEDCSAEKLALPFVLEDGDGNPIDSGGYENSGIYGALDRVDQDGYAYVTVSWINQLQQDQDNFETLVRSAISNVANMSRPEIGKEVWNDIDTNLEKGFKLKKVHDFEELLAMIAKCSGDERWLTFHKSDIIYRELKKVFCKKRSKDDTDKAIYRMCCVGLVEDMTIDYLAETYELKIKKKTDAQYKEHMLEFFRKYYSFAQASQKVEQIDLFKGRRYLDKCLGFITEFVYDNLEKKRRRAIDDMHMACVEGITRYKEDGNDGWLKDFIHLYFNSKYARVDYAVDGHEYSLAKDTDSEGLDTFDVVLKYIGVIDIDNSGRERDNVKHLYGATLMCLRAHPDNAALKLLRSYCISFLGVGGNKNLREEAQKSYVEGFLGLYENGMPDFWASVNQFNEILGNKMTEDFLKEDLLVKGVEVITLIIHERVFSRIKDRYIKIE